jgi:hypothetical protein
MQKEWLKKVSVTYSYIMLQREEHEQKTKAILVGCGAGEGRVGKKKGGKNLSKQRYISDYAS